MKVEEIKMKVGEIKKKVEEKNIIVYQICSFKNLLDFLGEFIWFREFEDNTEDVLDANLPIYFIYILKELVL